MAAMRGSLSFSLSQVRKGALAKASTFSICYPFICQKSKSQTVAQLDLLLISILGLVLDHLLFIGLTLEEVVAVRLVF